jgi:pilus assembly protein CpaE
LVAAPNGQVQKATGPVAAAVPALPLGLPDVSGTGGIAAAFVSGRGGVGKSALSLLTAALLQSRGLKVALVDLDLQFGDLAYLTDRVPAARMQRMGLAQAVSGPGRPQPAPGLLCLVEAGIRPEQAEEFSEELPGLITSLKQAADIVIVNAGSFWTELQAILAKSVDRLLFVMDQRSSSIRGCQQAVDLCIRLQIPTARFSYVLNRCGRNAPLTDMDVSLALGGAEVLSIADGGPVVEEMLSLGDPYELLASDAAFCATFDRLLGMLMAATAPSGGVGPAVQTQADARILRTGSLLPSLGAITGRIGGKRRGGGRVAS